MKKSNFTIPGVCFVIFAFAVISIANTGQRNSTRDKITPQELITKHLFSIGSPKALKSISSIMAVGTSKAVFKVNGSAEITGIVVMASEGDKNMIGMKFNHPEYEFEKMGYDGETFSVGYAKPGVRTPFGEFLLSNSNTFKSGIMGGVLSTSWELLNYDVKRGKLKFDGTKTIDGVQMYRFDYSPKKGSDLEIKLFFEQDSFRHVRTEYSRVITAPMGRTIEESSRQNETRYKMIELFDDFRVHNGVTLPYKYQIDLTLSNGRGSALYNWYMDIEELNFEQQLGLDQFRVNN